MHVCVCVCVCVLYSRQSLQEQVVERLPAAAASRHAEQQRVSEQRCAVRAAARAVVSVVRTLPQVESQQHLLLLLLLQHAQLVPEQGERPAHESTNRQFDSKPTAQRKKVFLHKDVVSVQNAAQRLVSVVDLIETMVEHVSYHHLKHSVIPVSSLLWGTPRQHSVGECELDMLELNQVLLLGWFDLWNF